MKEFLLDLFFPKYCVRCKKIGDFICPNCFSYIEFSQFFLCPNCNKGSIDGATHPKCVTRYSLDGALSAVVYKGIIKKLLYQFKYQPYLTGLQNILGELLYEGLIQNEVFYSLLQKNPIVISVPQSQKKQKSRGYDHAGLLAENFAKKLGLLYRKDVLIRVKETKPQYQLKREERLLNLKGAFDINKKVKEIEGKTILVIDDIATTFATLSECAKVLKKNGAKAVHGITLAREGN